MKNIFSFLKKKDNHELVDQAKVFATRLGEDGAQHVSMKFEGNTAKVEATTNEQNKYYLLTLRIDHVAEITETNRLYEPFLKNNKES